MTDLPPIVPPTPAVPPSGRKDFNPIGTFYFDGDSPTPRRVTLTVDRNAGVLEIGIRDQVIHWPLKDIREVEDVAGRVGTMLRLRTDPLARLQLVNKELMAEFPNLNQSAPPKGRGRLALWAVAAVVAVAVQITVLVPLLANQLAEFIPPEGERALGEATFGQIREAFGDQRGMIPLDTCDNPQGLAVLKTMATRLTEGEDLAHPIDVYVLDHEMVNAFALPGGYVVFFRGLIDAADGPDEVAAVLAHEIGHVVSRDPTRHALRSAGSIGILGLLLGDFAGGTVVLFLAERLVSAQYSQATEANADTYAHGALERANVSPAALGNMFERMREKYGDTEGVHAHFISHPTLSDRIEKARAANRENADYAPIVSDAEWEKLQNVCGYSDVTDESPKENSQMIDDLEAVSPLMTQFEIPDPDRPLSDEERGAFGPSGELMRFEPELLTEADVIGRSVDEISTNLGTYGMGGYGFFGLRLGQEWLVISISGAGEWITVDDVLVEDFFGKKTDRPEPWIRDDQDRLSPKLIGAKITAFEIDEKVLSIGFDNGMRLEITESPENRPVFEGTKKPRVLLEGDDLQRAVFLSPTSEIWAE